MSLLLRDSIEAIYSELRELAFAYKEQEFNQLLGIVGDYLEEIGDPIFKICRSSWKLRGPEVPYSLPSRNYIYISVEDLDPYKLQSRRRQTNANTFLFFPPKSLGIWGEVRLDKGNTSLYLPGIYLAKKPMEFYDNLFDPRELFL